MSSIEKEPMYLRPDVLVEPLVDSWYAWPHLVSPATAARNTTHRHLRIMESYLDAPEVHAAAVRNPALLGGPFMDFPTPQVEAIATLRQKTVARRARQIAFSRAIDELDELLRREADGNSLEPLYERVPKPLDGYVELLYDLSNHPSFRFIEPLLYRSELYDLTAQSVMLSLNRGGNRPFVFSTPRLIKETDLHCSVSFAHPGLDLLYKTASSACLLGDLKDALGWPDVLDEGMRALFTREAPRPYPSYRAPHVRWRYFGHACILVETATTSILIDPIINHARDSSIPHYSYDDLPEEIDFVLLSHNHHDHIHLETLLRLRHRIRHLLVPRSGHGALQDPSLRLMLQNIGFRNVLELGEFEEFTFASGSITGLPFFGEHGDLDIAAKLGWHVVVDGHRMLFAADSCNISPALYRHVKALKGSVDILFLGMECDGAPVSWIYGPLYTSPLPPPNDRARRLSGSDYPRARDLVRTLGCKQVYVYAMGQEPWLSHIMSKQYTSESPPIVASNLLMEECRRAGITCERLFGEKQVVLSDTAGR